LIDFEENKKIINQQKNRLENISSTLNLKEQEKKLEELEAQTIKDGFWNDNKLSNNVLKQIKEIKGRLKKYNDIYKQVADLSDLIELISIEYDEDLEKQLILLLKSVEKNLQKFEIDTLLSGKYDKNNAIISIHPGAGGTESQDWAEMLYRMYCRWANKNGYTVKELDFLEGEEAGIKSVTALITGENAYGYLKGEHGVHRLVRISPFDAGGRRHTSFASLEILPEITDDVEIDINPNDLRIDTYRASGAGGQHINKTDSAIRITHIPTGVVTSCQTERSQIQNRETAMRMLKSKLLDLKEKESKEKIDDLKGKQREIAWGSQIRSYVFCPYTLVKDHRTGYEVGNIEAVMDGNIDDFIEEYLKSCLK
jgi:peptide chain release factor 2